jgi:hypothetical protein
MNLKTNITNTMKRIQIYALVLSLSLPTIPLVAQEQDEIAKQDPKAREKIEAARIGLITERLQLTPEQAEKFWPVYREFAGKQMELRKELKIARKDIDPNNPDPQKEQALVDLGLKLKQRELDLEKDYSGRILKVISAQQMLNLRGAEKDFRLMILNQLQQRRVMQQRKENFRDKNQRLKRN